MIVRLLKLLFILAVLGLVGLVGYAYFGDLTPERSEQRVPVTLDVD